MENMPPATELPKRTELADLGEFALIERLTKGFKQKQASTHLGVGDDCAVIDEGEHFTVISTDFLIEGVHFDLTYAPLRHVGYKAVVVNLSDIYAMNAEPQQVLLALAVSNRFSVEALEELYMGVRIACERYGVDLVGGDLTTSPKGLSIGVTAIGRVSKQEIVYRAGAKKGDLLCVTGDLGGAYMGLLLLEREKRLFLEHPEMKPDLEEQAYLVGRQLKPEARKDIIADLKKNQLLPTAMLDLSDGLASDLRHICKASGLGAYVEEAALPVHPDTYNLSLRFNHDATTTALNGGEDYELLFTIHPSEADKIKYMLDVAIIGEMTDAADGISLHSKGGNIHPITAQGWKHF